MVEIRMCAYAGNIPGGCGGVVGNDQQVSPAIPIGIDFHAVNALQSAIRILAVEVDGHSKMYYPKRFPFY